MFIGAASLIIIYIYFGLWTMSACLGARAFSNPLWYGLVFIFWPIAVLVGLGGLFIEWIDNIKEYYKRKEMRRNEGLWCNIYINGSVSIRDNIRD